MNLSFYIARRYILGKKSHNAINIVSGISILSVVVGAMAFIVILSVFNGFDQLVQSMYNSFNPDIKIVPAKGKVFQLNTDSLTTIREIDGVLAVTEVLEDNALLKYNERQTVGTIKGVSSNYNEVTHIDSLIYRGKYELHFQSMPRGVIGRGLAYHLNLNPDMFEPLKVYVPKRNARISMDPNKSLNRKHLMVSGVFSSQPDIDGKYTIVPIEFAQSLFNYHGYYSSLEIKLKKQASTEDIQNWLEEYLGSDFIVKNKYEQNELIYKTMRTEKWAIFAILVLVLIILLFSLVGSLSMLIIEKKNDIKILHALGANNKLIQKIFYREGVIITLLGTLIGLSLGTTIVLLQQHFGLVRLQGGFIIDAYPVNLQFNDLLIVVATVISLGLIASWYPVKYLLKKSRLTV